MRRGGGFIREFRGGRGPFGNRLTGGFAAPIPRGYYGMPPFYGSGGYGYGNRPVVIGVPVEVPVGVPVGVQIQETEPNIEIVIEEDEIETRSLADSDEDMFDNYFDEE